MLVSKIGNLVIKKAKNNTGNLLKRFLVFITPLIKVNYNGYN
jgi:hypothetical protein